MAPNIVPKPKIAPIIVVLGINIKIDAINSEKKDELKKYLWGRFVIDLLLTLFLVLLRGRAVDRRFQP